MTGYTFESSRRMTAREQTAYDMGYEMGKHDAVVHGRWENIRMITTGDGRVRVGDCSNCKSTETLRNYCPNCGAKMDAEVSDNG